MMKPTPPAARQRVIIDVPPGWQLGCPLSKIDPVRELNDSVPDLDWA